MSILFLIVFLSGSVVAVNPPEGPRPDSCDIAEFDQHVQWVFYMSHPTRKLPKNQTEMDEFCNMKDHVETRIAKFAKRCLEKLPQTITSLLMFGVERQNRYYCSDSVKGRVQYLEAARCIEAVKTSGASCMNALIIDLLSLLQASPKKRIARLCCVYYRFEDCMMSAAHEKCSTRETKRFEDLIHGYTGQMLNNLCMNYPKEVDCAKIYPKRDWEEARRRVVKRNKKLPVSILPPLIDVISSLPVSPGRSSQAN